MSLAELLTLDGSREVSLTQLERYKRTDIGVFYTASVKVWADGAARASTANGSSQEAALKSAMCSLGLFPELAAEPRRRRNREDLLA